MAEQNLSPQLFMRVNLNKIEENEEIKLPEGYTIRTFREGEDKADEHAWDHIIGVTFQNPECTFEKLMRPDPAYRPDRIWFVCCDDEPVATAAGWFQEKYGEEYGYLHMVGALPEHAGKGLGIAVTKAAMYSMKKEGRSFALLSTDDFRLPAIKSYLRLGWEPKIVDDNQYDRWKKVYENLQWKAAPPVKE